MCNLHFTRQLCLLLSLLLCVCLCACAAEPAEIPPSTEATTEATTVATTEPPTEPDTDPILEYILNTNSHKFHHPDCASVDQMKESNKQPFTGTRSEAIAQGYSPCGNCHP